MSKNIVQKFEPSPTPHIHTILIKLFSIFLLKSILLECRSFRNLTMVPIQIISLSHDIILNYAKTILFPQNSKKLNMFLVESFIVHVIFINKSNWERFPGKLAIFELMIGLNSPYSISYLFVLLHRNSC